MVSRNVARRYAKGLLEAAAAAADGQERLFRDQLDNLVGTIRSHDGLHLLTVNPAIAAREKQVILSKIGESLGLSEVVRRFVDIVAENERLDQLPLIATVYAELVDQHLGIVNAEITTSTPLNPGQAAELEGSLRDATGAEVSISRRTDPALLGGVVTRIGDVIYDGSLRGHLARIRERLETS